MSAADANPLIRKLSAMFPLTAQEIGILANACTRTVGYGPNENIVREGDRPKNCNLLLEGWVCRYKSTAEGKRQILSFQFPGDLYDTQSFILDEMDHSISTLSPCKVGLIPHETMAGITEDYPRIARALWKETLVDASVFREWTLNVGGRQSYARMAHLMCEIFVRLRVVGLARGQTIDWPITQIEFGDALGITAVHVNRTLQELRADGIITLKDGTLVIDDWERLQTAGQFDQRYLHLTPKGADGADDQRPH